MSEGAVEFELKVFLCAIATKCRLGAHVSVLDILYTIFDVSVRPFVRSFVRKNRMFCYRIKKSRARVASKY